MWTKTKCFTKILTIKWSTVLVLDYKYYIMQGGGFVKKKWKWTLRAISGLSCYEKQEQEFQTERYYCVKELTGIQSCSIKHSLVLHSSLLLALIYHFSLLSFFTSQITRILIKVNTQIVKLNSILRNKSSQQADVCRMDLLHSCLTMVRINPLLMTPISRG